AIAAVTAAAEPGLHCADALVDRGLAVRAIAVTAIAAAQNLVEPLPDDVAAVTRITIAVGTAVARIILRRCRRRAGQRSNRDAARQKLRDCPHGLHSSHDSTHRAQRTAATFRSLSLRGCIAAEPCV